ncbi:hypothetical protein ACFC58_06625 [Kitasatospora purpeofusca]|uniref:hypothetical protein n=1 Tax=Kitasatospora purpeofusca TaxID=67352 RepID=UPI0035D9EC95
MSAQPLDFGPDTVPRNYNAITAALPENLAGQFTTDYHSASPFTAGAVLEYYGRLADACGDPGTAAAAARAVAEPVGMSLAAVLDEADR